MRLVTFITLQCAKLNLLFVGKLDVVLTIKDVLDIRMFKRLLSSDMLTPPDVREMTFNFLLFRRIAEIWRNNMFVIAWRLGDHSLWKSTHFLEKRKTG